MKTKFSRKTNQNKIFVICSLLVALLLSCLTVCIPHSLGSAASHAAAQRAVHTAAQSVSYDSAFMYEPTSAVTYASGITITLDQASGNLLTLENGRILQGENSSYSALYATNIFALGSNIVLVNKNETTSASTKIMVLDSQTKTRKDIEFAENTTPLQAGFTNVSAVAANDTLHVFFYSETFAAGAVYVTLRESSGTFTASAPRQISFNFTDPTGTASQIDSLNLCYDSAQNLPYAIVNTGDKFFVFYIQNDSDKISNITFEGNQFSAPTGSSVHTFDFSGKKYMMVQHGTTLDVHEYSISASSFDVAYAPVASKTMDLSSIDSVSLQGSYLTLTSTTDQKVVVTTIGFETTSLVFGESKYTSNPTVTVEFFESGTIGFGEITNSDAGTALKSSPFSSQTLTTIRPQSNIVHIGSGYMTYGDDPAQKITGYEYYMYTDSYGNNYYGFARIDEVTETLTPETTERTYVYARGGSKIYKYPSRTVTEGTNDLNEVIYTTTDLTRLEVKRDISSFYYSSGNGNNHFYEVEINGTVGYIQDVNVDKTQGGSLVQTNAVVLRTSVIYTNPNVDTNNTIYTLSEATRVRIIENRNGNEKYTKISFNDDSGNYYIGYILSENIKADSWTSMQLIGFTLVVFSIILLGVILIVKNKINHE